MNGYAPRYDKNVMERVAHKRHMTIVPCMVSSPYYGLGTWVYVWSHNKKILRHCRVADVSHPRDRERHIRTKRIVELSYEMAIELCGHEHLADPPTKCPVVVVRINE